MRFLVVLILALGLSGCPCPEDPPCINDEEAGISICTSPDDRTIMKDMTSGVTCFSDKSCYHDVNGVKDNGGNMRCFTSDGVEIIATK